jgi:hypothetical protein
VDQGEEETWDTVGAASERSRSLDPTTEVTVPEMAQRAAVADRPRSSSEERSEPSSTVGAVEPGEAYVEEEAPAKAGLVDIANILGLRP